MTFKILIRLRGKKLLCAIIFHKEYLKYGFVIYGSIYMFLTQFSIAQSLPDNFKPDVNSSTYLLTNLKEVNTTEIPLYSGELLTFDVHFCIITSNTNAHARASLAQMRREVEILNTFFVREDRKPLVSFRFKSAHFWDDIRSLNCPFVCWGDVQTTNDYAVLFNECTHTQVKDANAINFYIYDEVGGINCHGRRNSNRPLVLIDKERLDHRVQSPEEHEMGHAFGLSHVCTPGAKISDPTNIMSSAGDCSGSGGLRNIGFDNQQTQTILYYAALIHQRLVQKPAESTSTLKMSAAGFQSGGGFKLEWNGMINHTYRVLRSNSVSFNNAIIMQSAIPGRYPINSFIDYPKSDHAFYLVEEE
jgi:hypothetical protein